MFAFAVPNEFFILHGHRVILRIMGKAYSSTFVSSHSTTPSVCVVMFVTRMSEPSCRWKTDRALPAAGRARRRVLLAEH